jgi:DNA polymerase-1
VLDLLDAFLDFATVDKLYGTFIPAMEAAVEGPDGCFYLFGNFNLGGTVSGRLSSSGPNLQTIPSGNEGDKTKKGRYGKLIKSCFQAPKGSLFIGLDFNSLEDRISALTTEDVNKIKVYSDGYDGHSLRAHSYFGNQMPDIETAPKDAICYNALVGGDVIWFHSKEQIHYLGQSMTGQELYEHLASVPV